MVNLTIPDHGSFIDSPDVLSSFNKPSTSKRPLPASPPKAPTAGSSGPQPSSGTEQQATVADDEDSEASLVEGMESLLRQLAGDHPPGPMPDTTDVKSDKKETLNPADLKPGSTEASPAGIGLSPEEEEAAWQRAVEMMLSGEGLEALGLDKSGIPNSAPPLPDRGAPVKEEKKGEQLDFDETIRRTMEQLKSPRGKSRGGGESNGAPDIAALLAQLGSDPSALEGLGEGDDELGGLLDGMMAQLMTKEILEEPMAELASKVSMSSPRLPRSSTRLQQRGYDGTLISVSGIPLFSTCRNDQRRFGKV